MRFVSEAPLSWMGWKKPHPVVISQKDAQSLICDCPIVAPVPRDFLVRYCPFEPIEPKETLEPSIPHE